MYLSTLCYIKSKSNQYLKTLFYKCPYLDKKGYSSAQKIFIKKQFKN